MMTRSPKSARPGSACRRSAGADEREEDHPASRARSRRCARRSPRAFCTSTIACGRGCNRWPNAADRESASAQTRGPRTRARRVATGRRAPASRPAIRSATRRFVTIMKRALLLAALALIAAVIAYSLQPREQGRVAMTFEHLGRVANDLAMIKPRLTRHRFLRQSLRRHGRCRRCRTGPTRIARGSRMCRPISRSIRAPGSQPARRAGFSMRMPRRCSFRARSRSIPTSAMSCTPTGAHVDLKMGRMRRQRNGHRPRSDGHARADRFAVDRNTKQVRLIGTREDAVLSCTERSAHDADKSAWARGALLAAMLLLARRGRGRAGRQSRRPRFGCADRRHRRPLHRRFPDQGRDLYRQRHRLAGQLQTACGPGDGGRGQRQAQQDHRRTATCCSMRPAARRPATRASTIWARAPSRCSGNVVLTKDKNVMRGTSLVVDLDSGRPRWAPRAWPAGASRACSRRPNASPRTTGKNRLHASLKTNRHSSCHEQTDTDSEHQRNRRRRAGRRPMSWRAARDWS